MTQSDQILEALQRGECLTPLESLRRFGTLRLGARIWDLKQKGYNIETRLVKVGPEGKTVASYFIPINPPVKHGENYPLPI